MYITEIVQNIDINLWQGYGKGRSSLWHLKESSMSMRARDNLPKSISLEPSVPNSSYRLIFVKIWAKYGHFFGKKTGENTGKIQACDFVVFL